MNSLVLNNMDTFPAQVEEAFNRLRVNFGFCGAGKKKVLIASSLPNEGKSFVSVNLWRMLAEVGNNVVLVDADLRKSVLRSRYRFSSEKNFPGLSHYLSGQAGIKEVLYSTNISNGYIVPVSYTISNPSLLFHGDAFPALLDALAENFEYVLVDTPPLTNVADATQIASFCDGALLVVKSGETPRKLISASISQLKNANCELLGVVLNQTHPKDSRYYSKYMKNGYYSSDNNK